ncbi:DNA polymerase alpha catalytic subunit-like [Gigantopelta aegis]|uniref:DNA polymerase alpha catalytic subunit-like n=1 Tax=Gigantopelta aegis TaxID=1735272 RepID=UPI001B8893EB|nr:DNA polymerase alpha catalytic subunit-like [Gigantopelta aegis]
MAPSPAVDNDKTNDDQDTGIRSRSKRQKFDKSGRLAAFERLKKTKERGEKNKYIVEEEKDVYELVDEAKYSELVRQRQEDDWIVDDDGSGYVEDGREIFDDDIHGEETSKTEAKGKAGGERKKNRNIVRPGSKPKQDIKSMFAAASFGTKKKPEKDVSLADDDILGDLMQELRQGPTVKPLPTKMNKTKSNRSAYNPFSVKPIAPPVLKEKTIKRELDYATEHPTKKTTFTKIHMPKPVPVKMEPFSVDDQMNDDAVSAEVDDIMDVTDQQNGHPSGQGDVAMDLNDIDFDDDDVQDSKPETDNNKPSVVKTKPQPVVKEEFVSAGWDNMEKESVPTVDDVHVDTTQLPLTANNDGEQVLRFYWLDAYEDYYKHPGIVYLFGKVWIDSAKTFVSCCVTVRNIERRVYLLPRPTRMNMKTGEDTGESITMMDTYEEFNERVTEKYRIMKFKSMKVTKQYAFEKTDVPVESDYLEVRYSADLPPLPADLKGETFSHVFGANTSSLEILLLDRKMKGPGWLDLKCPQITNPPISWCKVEAFITKPENVSVVRDSNLTPPPLVVMTLNLRTLPNPKTHQNEIIAASCLIQNNFQMDKPAPSQLFQQHFCAITKPNDCIFPFDLRERVQQESHKMKTEISSTERGLLGFLLAKIHKVDPDLLLGHDIYGFDLDVLLHRINANKIPHWSKIGRLKRSVMPRLSGSGGKGGFAEKTATCGRLLCDVKISAKELLRCRSYDLTELSHQILKCNRKEIDYEEIKNMYSSSKQLLGLIETTLMDSTYILRILYELNIIPLAHQITTICGNVMSRTLMGGRSERNELLLLHAFFEKNFVLPDKDYKKKTVVNTDVAEDDDHDSSKPRKNQGRRKPAYAGGLVLEPKKGFYDKFILLLDFNSLYPSIIQEYNICFTTINRTAANKSGNNDEDDPIIELPDPDLEPGILPTEIRKLVESRKQVKQLMKQPDVTPEQYMQYDIRQKALKLTANSMYGCLGFTFSRFYAKPLAALITSKGREILMKTKDLVESMNLEVIYGDTDSIMINTNCTDIDQVMKLGNKIKQEVNKLFRLLEIDIDGVFKSMLLLKKKKYAALSMTRSADGKYTTTQELKGLDIVRRDWSDLAKDAGNFVVSQILSGESAEVILENIHSKLQEVGVKVMNNELPVDLYYITKQLTKNPEDYPDKKSLPHVQVALRLNSKGGKRLRSGDTVSYIICQDGSSLAASQRAYHPDELAKSDNLKIDTKYYLAHQVHPVVCRLCDPIEGTDAARLAECLGLDPSGYRHVAAGDDDAEDALLGVQLSEEERYKDCDRFKFRCPGAQCGREIILDSVFTGADKALECSLSKCPNPQCRCVPSELVNQIENQLVAVIRKHIRRYYEGWLRCEDSTCGSRTRKTPLTFYRGHPICSVCQRGSLHQEYTDCELYTQLCFYQYVFDTDKALAFQSNQHFAKTILAGYEEAYRQLKNTVGRWLRRSAYSEVNLTKLFDGLFQLR